MRAATVGTAPSLGGERIDPDGLGPEGKAGMLPDRTFPDGKASGPPEGIGPEGLAPDGAGPL